MIERGNIRQGMDMIYSRFNESSKIRDRQLHARDKGIRSYEITIC